MLTTVTTAHDLRFVINAWRKKNKTIGFVPTMGALHDGHMALVKRAQSLADHTIASIFVNPLQFGPTEDLSRYPRPLEADQKRLESAGCDVLFTPSVEEMYPEGFATQIDPGPLATVLEGAIRPSHFAGVATVVTKFLMMVRPDYACFGEKDYQQLQVIHQIVRDLAIPVSIVPVPIVREADGLALSSRNAYLSPDERVKAPLLSKTLFDVAEKLRAGADIDATLESARKRLTDSGFTPDYLVLADSHTLAPLNKVMKDARLLVAARLGTTRLIDNIAVNETEK
jgi:pantoate--beta-alanine ligase